MEFFTLGEHGPRVSRVVLGGHEYLADGRSRGFNEDFARSVTPGAIVEGFGGPKRLRIVEAALELGINCFDVTIDSEKDALGRNLKELTLPFDIFVQTRPEGMVYSYDPANRKMLDLALLRDEVLRIIKLLRRDRIDILNFGILQDALDSEPEFLDRLGANIAALKQEGLIGYAAADSFSGPYTYAAMIASGAFDSININYNVAEDWPRDTAIPTAKAADCAVLVREALIKGELFRITRGLDAAATGKLARGAIKWAAATEGVDGIILGAASLQQLHENADAVLNPAATEDEQAILAQTMGLRAFQDLRNEKNRLADGGRK